MLSEHIEDMRATYVMRAPFKGGLRSKPPREVYAKLGVTCGVGEKQEGHV